MKFRVLSLALGAIALFSVMGLWAQDSIKSGPSKTTEIRDDTALQEQILGRQFKEFLEQVLKLKQRLERSPRAEDQEQAKNLQRVLDRASDIALSTRFEKIVKILKTEKFNSINEIAQAAQDSKKLADDVHELIEMMKMDTRTSKIRDDIEKYKDIIKKIDDAIQAERQAQGLSDLNKTGKNELIKVQEKGKEAVTKVKDALDKKEGKSGQGGEAKDMKGAPKDGGKNEGKKGEAKGEGKSGEAKKGETKENAGDKNAKNSEAKGDNKEGKPGAESQPAESKSGKQGADSKPAEAKGSKGSKGSPGDAKESKPGDGKPADSKDAGKGDPKDKTAEAKIKTKAEEKKPGESKEGKGSDNKENKAGAKESKGSPDGKQAQPKSGGESKSGESKKGEAKSGSESKGQSSSKSGGEPKQGSPQAQPKGGDDQQQPKAGNNSPKEQPIGKKQVQDAEYKAQQAVEKAKEGDNTEASKKNGETIKDLEIAKKKLEDLLNQLREEEMERILANLIVRCERMLALQTEVLHGTEQVFKAIEANADKKPARDQQIHSSKLSNKEKEIIGEANKAIEILTAEGSAVAFPVIFHQVREDMKQVDRRLDVTDAGIVTQGIEKDIIITLKEMIDALKDSKKKLEDKKNPPSKPGEQKAKQPQDQKLLEQIAELKMIKSMQLRLNDRTELYGKRYQGEQAQEPAIRVEVQNLGRRQEEIFEVTNKIAKGDNK